MEVRILLRSHMPEINDTKEFGVIPPVTGPGLESLAKGKPMIIATTHFTHTDPQYAVLGLKDRLGGMQNIDIAQSSTHDSWTRPMYKLGTSIINLIARGFRSRDILKSISHDFTPVNRSGKTVMSEPGQLKPSDWQSLEQTLQEKRALVTAAYYDEKGLWSLPDHSGLLPIILKHSVPEADLVPVATIFSKSVYDKKEAFPVGRPTIAVGEPVDLPALTWKSSESQKIIASTLPDFTGSPIEFFKLYMQKRGERGTPGSQSINLAPLNKEAAHIMSQLRSQSEGFMEAYRKLIPDYIPTKQ